MKRIILAALAVFAIVALPAQAGKRSPCTVVPDPVSISAHTLYTVTATGGTPGTYYEIIISQRHDGVTDEGRDALVQADGGGAVAYTFTAYPWVDGSKSGLLVGDAKVSVVRYRTGGGSGGAASTLETCTFTVVE